jgi:thioredoxin-like negative regulator of GroEL
MITAKTDDAELPELKRARGLWVANRFDDAVKLFTEIAAKHPDNVAALVDTARALGHRHEIKRATEYLERLRAINPDRADLPFILGQSFRMIHREDLAIPCFEAYVAKAGRKHADAHFELAVLYERRHRLEEAEAAVDRVMKLNPQYFEAWLMRGRLLLRRGEAQKAAGMFRRLALNSQAHIITRAQAWAALASLADKEGNYEEAVRCMAKCKDIQIAHAQVFQSHSDVVLGNLQRFGESITADHLRRWRAQKDLGPPARVAQLAGFPRSGTTLLENVLDAHSGLVSSEELQVFGRDILDSSWKESHEITPPTAEAFDKIPLSKLQHLRRRYLAAIEETLDEPVGDRVHLDKNPTHTLFIPAIVRLFPETKFLIALRDPRDVIVSCYLQYLPLNPTSSSFLTWDSTARRYALDLGMWLRLRPLLDPETWTEVRYEDLVQDLQASARRALTFLNLPWEDSVLGYRDRLAAKTVHSPTYLDVAKPVYRGAIGRWRNYSRWLEPSLPVLERFVKEFGYD